MSGFEDARRAIETGFAAGWATAAFASTPVWYQGAPFEAPEGPYLALAVVGTSSRQCEIAGEDPAVRYTGFLQLDACVPEESGTALPRKLLDAASAVVARRTMSYGTSGQIVFRTMSEPLFRSIAGRTVATCHVDYHRDARS